MASGPSSWDIPLACNSRCCAPPHVPDLDILTHFWTHSQLATPPFLCPRTFSGSCIPPSLPAHMAARMLGSILGAKVGQNSGEARGAALTNTWRTARDLELNQSSRKDGDWVSTYRRQGPLAAHSPHVLSRHRDSCGRPRLHVSLASFSRVQSPPGQKRATSASKYTPPVVASAQLWIKVYGALFPCTMGLLLPKKEDGEACGYFPSLLICLVSVKSPTFTLNGPKTRVTQVAMS